MDKEKEVLSYDDERTVKEKISDFIYESNRKMFHKNPEKPIKTMSVKNKRILFIFALLLIPCLNWLVFWLYTNLQSIALAFQDANTGAWTFDNFVQVWENINKTYIASSRQSLFMCITNTFKYFGTTLCINVPLCLIISFFMYKRIAGYKFFRLVFYLPAIISSVALVTAYTEFLQPNGPFFTVVKLLGGKVDKISVLEKGDTAMSAVLVYHVLTGFTTNVLLFTSGMARIPLEVIEAAKLDGVGPVREIIRIIFPLIWPTFSTQMLFILTGFFNSSGPILLFSTNTQNYTATIHFWLFDKVLYGQYNLPSAAGLCCTFIGVPIILIVRKVVEKIEPVEY